MGKQTENDIFDIWKETQKQLWENLSTIPNPFEFPKKLGFLQHPGFQLLSTWGEAAINQSLEVQSSWLDQWAARARVDAMDPEVFSKQLDQINSSMERWTATQKELWERWFTLLEASTALPGIGETQQKILDDWKATVGKTFAEQSNWVSLWQDQINCKFSQENELQDFMTQLKDSMEGCVQNQMELWQQWFNFLNAEEKQQSFSLNDTTKGNGSGQRTGEQNDLKTISGIGPALEKKLNEQGIVRYKQIANLTDDEIDRLEHKIIGFPGRIRRQGWIRQAKTQCAES